MFIIQKNGSEIKRWKNRISEFVQNKYPDSIPYEMSYRDGVPLILPDEDTNFFTQGYLIYF